MSHPFQAGERILLVDSKDRRYLVKLREGASYHTHAGGFEMDSLIGLDEGARIETSKGAILRAFRPTLSDVIFKMPRGAQVIYPKDLGPILIYADIFPGVKVLEAGVGSGALSMAMLRAGAIIKGYEIRPEFAKIAADNVEEHFGTSVSYEIEERDIYEGINETDLDRIILDLPEPWNVLPYADKSLKSGGIVLAYLPTINQTTKFVEALEENNFFSTKTIEILERSWHIEGRSVRPDHRMVAHTGFLTVSRYLGPKESR